MINYVQSFLYPGDRVLGEHVESGRVLPVLRVGDVTFLLNGTDAEMGATLRSIAREATALAEAAEIRSFRASLPATYGVDPDLRAIHAADGLTDESDHDEPDGPPDHHWRDALGSDSSAYRRDMRDAGRGAQVA